MPADFPSKVVAVMLSSWRLIGQLWYYLAVGVLLAAWLDQAIPSHKLQQFFSGKRANIALATLVGAAANVVVANLAEKSGNPISFKRFLGYGLVTTVMSLVLATGYVWLRYL